MNPLDLTIVAVMVFLLIRGIMRGFFRETGSIAGVVLGIWLGNKYHPAVAGYLSGYIPSFNMLSLFSFGLIFALVLIFCNLIGWGLKLLFKKTLFGWADRSMGVGLAFIKGIIIIYLAIVLITFIVPSTSPLIARSKLAPMIIHSYQTMVSVVSPGSYEKWKNQLIRKSEEWNSNASENKGESPETKD